MNRWRVPVRRGRAGAGGVDQYGETIPGERVWEELPPALFASDGGSDVLEPGVASVRQSPALYWRGSAPDVRAGDVVEVSGQRFEVVGDIEDWPKGDKVNLLKVVKGV